MVKAFGTFGPAGSRSDRDGNRHPFGFSNSTAGPRVIRHGTRFAVRLADIDNRTRDLMVKRIQELYRQRRQNEDDMRRVLVQAKANASHPLVASVEKKNGKFTVAVAVGKATRPQQLKVLMKGHSLFVTLKVEKNSADGTSHMKQTFCKMVAWPQDVKKEGVKSCLTREGVLIVEAPLLAPERFQEVPIAVNVEDAEDI